MPTDPPQAPTPPELPTLEAAIEWWETELRVGNQRAWPSSFAAAVRLLQEVSTLREALARQLTRTQDASDEIARLTNALAEETRALETEQAISHDWERRSAENYKTSVVLAHQKGLAEQRALQAEGTVRTARRDAIQACIDATETVKPPQHMKSVKFAILDRLEALRDQAGRQETT